MAKKLFTEEEIARLKASEYVLAVSPRVVHFSAAFKERFWALMESGVRPSEAVESLGIDPEILGEHRVSGLKIMIRKEVRAGNGFRDLETYAGYVKYSSNPTIRIRQLEQQLAYKDQELEFLKKIVFLGKEETVT
jgi:hypothetical protein